MNGARAILEMLRKYEVEYVFGLPGETTIPIYMEWDNYSEDIKHILTRDERSSAFMADAYARVSFKPGILDAPSSGATHILPGIAEAYKSSTPIIAFTTDVPLHTEKMNMLTGYDQSALFRGVVKDTYTITRVSEVPYAIRRAFRVATTGKPGPVHIRIPFDILKKEHNYRDIYSQKDFVKYPGHRFIADIDKIKKAIEVLTQSEKPVIVCGQGVLYSQAWNEVIELAEYIGIPVGTTITGKGCMPETHPLSIGVVGSRGGTSFSNDVIKEADTIFYIGSNTDSAATDTWSIPDIYSDKKIIHLDVSEENIANIYNTDVILLGDAKATLYMMIKILKEGHYASRYLELPRVKKLIGNFKYFQDEIAKRVREISDIHPLKIIKIMNEKVPEESIIVADPGVSAIYTSTYWRNKKAGRIFIFNYSIGALGYALPASVGAYIAKPNSTVLCLTGDGSFGFTAGELETIKRLNANIKIFLFNNRSFGWIRASIFLDYGPRYFSTDFTEVDYQKVSEGFGISYFKVLNYDNLTKILDDTKIHGPAFVEIEVKPEDAQIPPVPKWLEKLGKGETP